MTKADTCLPSVGGHDYAEFSGGSYLKHDGTQGAIGPTYDQFISYQRLYCRKCGDTIEVVARDHSKKGGDS